MLTKDEKQCEIANNLYDKLNSLGIETILDDRNERPGVKFNDAELIGIPYRITVGKKANEGIVEVKHRNEEEIKEMTIDEVISLLDKEVHKV